MKGRFIVPCRLASLTSTAAGNAIGTIAQYTVPYLPARCVFHVLLGVEADGAEAGLAIELGLEVRSPDWELLYCRPLRFRPGAMGERGEPWVCYCAAEVAFTAKTAGEHEVRCCLDDSVLVRAGISVVAQRRAVLRDSDD